MNNKMETELREAEAYFKKHPHRTKYRRRDSGLSASYLQDEFGHVTRLANKDELDRIVGEGGFGRVKKSTSTTGLSVTKIQISPVLDDDSADLFHEDKQSEASINLDLGIAKGPLIIRRIVDGENKYYKYYQDMFVMEQTLEDRLPRLDKNRRLESAIDLIITIDDCHNGGSKSGTGYVHGDISSANVMYDKEGKMYLIDFGVSEKLTRTRLLRKDHKSLSHTLFHSYHPQQHASIFNEEEWASFPMFIQNILSYEQYLELNMPDDQYLTFAAAVLISYKNDPNITEARVNDLKNNPFNQACIVEQYRRDKTISQIAESTAENVLEHMIQTLKRYHRFLDGACSVEGDRLFMQKKEIIDGILDFISQNKDRSAHELLVKIDTDLRAHDSVLSRGSNHKLGGVLGYISSKINSLTMSAEHASKIKLDGQFKATINKSREILQSYRDRAETPPLSDSESDEDDLSRSP